MDKLQIAIKNSFLVVLSIFLLGVGSVSAATITVDSVADNTTASDANCTLREAITNANNDADSTGGDCIAGAGADTIEFSIGSGLQTISLLSDLPEITTQIAIDATTQPGAPTAADCTTKDLLINLTTAVQDVSGFSFSAAATGSSVRGFYLHNFVDDADLLDGDINNAGISSDGSITVTCNVIGLNTAGAASGNTHGVFLSGSNASIGAVGIGNGNIISGNLTNGIRVVAGTNNTIQNNFIGTNIDGTADLGNASQGVLVTTGATTTIGPGNLISGNDSDGIRLQSDSHTIVGNIIGLNATGTATIPNSGHGILGLDVSNITVGGGALTDRNIISGNSFDGIFMDASTDNNFVVQGNYIGTNLAGDAGLGNSGYGVRSDSIAAQIGGPNAGEGNVISGNGGAFDAGVFLEGDGNIVQGNIVGLNAAGTAAIPNPGNGFTVSGQTNTFGGDTVAERNVISGNGGIGIRIFFSSNNTIQGNYIGTSSDGTVDLGNGGIGVFSFGTGNTIGGPNAGEGNVISGNGGVGVSMNEVVLQGNIIGLNAAGTAAIGNDGGGASVSTGTFGGDTAAERNVISGNGGTGIEIFGNNQSLQGNYIGLDATGVNTIGNTGSGVVISADDVLIGGLNAGEENFIGGNQVTGVLVNGNNARLQGNAIGLNTNFEPAGNSVNGVTVAAVNNVDIGGVTAAHRNLISSNGESGIFVQDNSTDVSILGNYIGTDDTGTVIPLGLGGVTTGNGLSGSFTNDYAGIVARSSSSVQIGNFDGTGANLIAGNIGPGIIAAQDTALAQAIVTILSNVIRDNQGIGIDLSNDTDSNQLSDVGIGVNANDASDGDTGANDFLNFIETTAITDNGPDFTIDYTLDAPAGNYVVQFFENTTADGTNHGEGETLAGSFTITHGGTGSESFSNNMVLANSANVSATVTQDLGGGTYGFTSEFSEIFAAAPPVVPPVSSGGGGGGSSSSKAPFSNPFKDSPDSTKETSTSGSIEVATQGCSGEQALKDIQKFKNFDKEISRFEALEYVLLINCIGLDELPENSNDYPFSDIDLSNERFARILYTGYNRNIVMGYPDGTFRPNDTINYVELLAINARAKDLAQNSEEEGEEWYSSYLGLRLTIVLALNDIEPGDAMSGDVFYKITKTFIDS